MNATISLPRSSMLPIAMDELLHHTSRLLHVDTQIQRATGRNFNIFSVLGIIGYEAWTHSPMLGEILSPAGRHGQGGKFLSAFIRLLNRRLEARRGLQVEVGDTDNCVLDVATARVIREYYIGPVTETSGGKIDLLIEDAKGSRIIIENKIFAADQKNQLARYRHFGPKAYLVYLTLDGKEPPNEVVKTTTHARFATMSYEKDVIAWLEECRNQVIEISQVRDTLTQYLHAVRNLTHQNHSPDMNTEIAVRVMRDEDSLRAFFALLDTKTKVIEMLMAPLKQQIQALATRHSLDLVYDGELPKKWSAFRFENSEMNARNVSLGFGLEYDNQMGFFFGIRRREEPLTAIQIAKLGEVFGNTFGKREGATEWWPASLYWDHYRNWDSNTYAAILNGTFIRDVEQVLEKLIRVQEAAFAPEGDQEVSASAS